MLFLGLISADDALCHALAEQLRQNSQWQHTVFGSLETALATWGETLPPLLFWDAESAPATEELTDFFAARLTAQRPTPLLLVLGSFSSSLEKTGVTEVFLRPLRLGHLLTRLQFYQRLLQQAPDATWRIGPWLFSPRARRLSLENGEDSLRLTDKEAAVLEYLYTADSVVPREEILAAIWGYGARIDTHTLETHIYRLRRKLIRDNTLPNDVFITDGGGYSIHPSWRGS